MSAHRFIIKHKCKTPGWLSRWWKGVGENDEWICSCNSKYMWKDNAWSKYRTNWAWICEECKCKSETKEGYKHEVTGKVPPGWSIYDNFFFILEPAAL